MLQQNVRVLYIDDEENNLLAFRATFRRIFEVFTAESAMLGLQILEKHDVHIILCDQRMPLMTGIQFFASILDTRPEPIRILLTGYTDVHAVIDAINIGQVYKYLTKPWDEFALKNTILKAYEVYCLRRDNRLMQQSLALMNTRLEALARKSQNSKMEGSQDHDIST